MFILLLIHIELYLGWSQAYSCNNAYQCLEQNISNSDGSTSIECLGYQSCAYASSIIASGMSGEFLQCGGSLSCYGAQSVQVNNSEGSIHCRGSYSCSNIKSLIFERIPTSKSIEVHCGGEGSCTDTTLTQRWDSSSSARGVTLKCFAASSCQNMTLNNITQVNAEHYQSLANSTFHSHYNGQVTAQLRGIDPNTFISSNNSDNINNNNEYNGKFIFICDPDHNTKCQINCYDNGCDNLEIYCGGDNMGGSSCDSILTIDCTTYGAAKSDNCPDADDYLMTNNNNNNNNQSEYEILTQHLVELMTNTTTVTSFISNCVSNNSSSSSSSSTSSRLLSLLTCDDYQDTECRNINFLYTYDNVCCLGDQSCYNTDTVDSNIVCDGYYACQNADIEFMITSSSNYSDINNKNNFYDSGVLVSGFQSGLSTKVTASTNVDNNRTEINVYCRGESSCAAMNIDYVTNVFCGAWFACEGATINNILGNVIAYAYRATISTTSISSVTGNMYCLGYESCRSTTISDIQGSVYVIGAYQILYQQATITNVYGDVFISVSKSQASDGTSTITNVAGKLTIYGTQAGDSLSISNTGTIIANGYDVMAGSTIESNLGKNGINLNKESFRLSLNGTSVTTFNVNCTSNDICFIICQTYDSCNNMILDCIDGTHDASIDSDFFTFDNINGSYSVTTNCHVLTPNETLFPTNQPTLPTSYPSSQPSQDPTTIPSSQPTHIPTFNPTMPSVQPTTAPSIIPTTAPTINPATPPTAAPSQYPSQLPSTSPSIPPTTAPSQNPSKSPSMPPSIPPTSSPIANPTFSPSLPSVAPTVSPTYAPSKAPSMSPTYGILYR